MFSQQKQLDQIPHQRRVTILYEYLVKGHSMDKIAKTYYNDNNWAVSAVCKGYSEEGGLNKGQVSATREEVSRFVRKYPNGTFDEGITLRKFLSQSKKTQHGNGYSQTYQTYDDSYYDDDLYYDNLSNSSKLDTTRNVNKDSVLSTIFGNIVVGLLVWFIVGKWFGHPIVALIIIGLLIFGCYGLIMDEVQ